MYVVLISSRTFWTDLAHWMVLVYTQFGLSRSDASRQRYRADGL